MFVNVSKGCRKQSDQSRPWPYIHCMFVYSLVKGRHKCAHSIARIL